MHVNSIPTGTYGGICCLKNTAPGQSDDFVKGMQYIQDRERIVRSILKGHGMVGNDHPISPAYGKEHCSELPQRPYDPDKAKWHLKKSGYTSAELFVAPVVSGGNWNDTFWNNERFGKLLKLSLAETDPAKRYAMNCEMQTLVHDGSGMVIPYHVNNLDGVSDKVHGIPKQPLGDLGGCEWPEFVWIDA